MASGMYCSFEMFKILVDRGADIHVRNDTPLYWAIWQHAYGHWNYESVIRYLAGLGCRPRGLYHCCLGGNLQLARLMVELGADVNETDDSDWPGRNAGCTPLDYCTGIAGDHEHPDIAAFLRDHGARHAAVEKT